MRRIEELSDRTLEAFEKLFGTAGACAGCWCQWFSLTTKEFEASKGDLNRQRMRDRVKAGERPGLLIFEGDDAVGWCALGPRESYGRLERSRILKRVDETPVGSVVCFFVAKGFRGRGVSVELLEAAKHWAREQGIGVLEGYPVDPEGKYPPAFAYHGLAKAFERAGFKEVERRSATRPIMRWVMED